MNLDNRLSICMIVKNEEKNIRRCLDSLLPLVIQDWCELIIVDTGSTDKTLDIVSMYTDNWFPFEWNGDFSAARNESISHASGEWIFIIDADECLKQESIYNLLSLFESDDEDYNLITSKFNTVLLKVRNFTTTDRKLFRDMLHPRLFRHTKEFKYRGKIHNIPNGQKPYLFGTNIILFHYGYMYEDDINLLANKTARTLPPLEEAYKKNPDDIHTVVHLLKSYCSIQEWDNMKGLTNKYIKLLKGIEYHEGWFGYLEGFILLATCYTITNDLKNLLKVVRECEKYSKRVPNMYILLGQYYSEKSLDNKKACMYFEKSIEVMKKKGSEYEMLLISNARLILPEVYNWLSIHYFQKGDFEKSGEMLQIGITLNQTSKLPLRWDIWNEGSSQLKYERIGGNNGQKTKGYKKVC